MPKKRPNCRGSRWNNAVNRRNQNFTYTVLDRQKFFDSGYIRQITPFLFLFAVIEYLVSKGADVNAKDKDGKTPLLAAIARNNSEVAKFLVSKGANANPASRFGISPPAQSPSRRDVIPQGSPRPGGDSWRPGQSSQRREVPPRSTPSR
ncbi:MAG: ankyrin repeat domain-containing protein [Planctomycetaceae bacterium]|nr:ankyrin repeat domain-containing protein [Planctomycetaceae bacterium]